MPRLIVKNGKLCVVNNHLVTDANGAPCVCDLAGCDDLPPRVKVTIQGRASFFNRFENPEGFIEIDEKLTIPPIVFTADRANNYRTTLACPARILGSMRNESGNFVDPNGSPVVYTGQPFNVYEVQLFAGNIDPAEPDSLCILQSVAVITQHESSIDQGQGGVYFRAYHALYNSLQSPFIGVHPAFGHSINGDFYENEPGVLEGGPLYLVAQAEPVFLPGGFGTNSVYTPSSWQTNPQFGLPDTYTTAWSPWQVTIEPYEGDPICDASPIVYAVRCGDDLDNPSEKITVDLVDRLEGVANSLPFYDDSVWVPIDENSSEPVTTHIWIAGECDTTEYPVYELCPSAGGGSPILVDESNKPASAVSAIYQGQRYVPTGEVQIGPTVAVQWSDDACPEGDLYERCESGISHPSIQTRVRMNLNGADYARVLYSYQTVVGQEVCQFLVWIGYRKITDDGGVYQTRFGSAEAGPCDQIPDRVLRRSCTRDPDRPGDPVDPPQFESPAGGSRSRLPIVDLDGFDPETERRAAQQGGCCGQPVNR